jgi:3-methyladenine DNA glycosylase AlkD
MAASLEARVQAALEWLRGHATQATLDGMARYAIPSDKALGVAMKDIKALGKALGRDQALAVALWRTGVYEARMLAAFVGDPARLTPAQMDRWCRDFDNWAFCDAISFNLFDRTPHAWDKVVQWSLAPGEFQKRTAFALLWSLTVHDKQAGNEAFVEGLALIEREAGDERNFVKKAVNMALRAIGKRNRELHAAAVVVARRLANAKDATAKWIGKDALRELTPLTWPAGPTVAATPTRRRRP